MKVFISGLAIFALFMFAVTFQLDYKNVENNEMILKTQSDEILAGAALLWKVEEYADGYIKFNDQEIIKMLKHSVGNKYEYEVYIFDDSKELRIYSEKGLKSSKDFSYPHIYADKDGGKVSIKQPSIIMEINLNRVFYRMKSLKKFKQEIRRSTMYVVEGRNK